MGALVTRKRKSIEELHLTVLSAKFTVQLQRNYTLLITDATTMRSACRIKSNPTLTLLLVYGIFISTIENFCEPG